MKSDLDKSKDELVQELGFLRRKAAEADELRRRLANVQKSCDEFKHSYDARTEEYNKKCTERDQTETALRMAQVIVDRSPVILFRRLAGDNARLEYVSENVRQLGYTAEEFLSEKIHFKDVVHPDDIERIGQEIRKYAAEDVEEYTQVYRHLTKSGEVRWVEDQTSVVRDAAGIKTHNQGILVDITERKLAEDALRKSEEKFRRIVETAAEGFILMDEDLVIVSVNDAYCRMLGYTREELIGKTPLDLATDEFSQYMLSNRESILAQEYREFEGSSVAKDGRHVPILVHGNTLRDDQGNVIGNMAFITDMTENKKALALAGEVQKSLLPQDKPRVQGLDIAGRNVSCDEIGGDYFDFLWRRDSTKGPFSVVVGDISGHGVDSALLMTTARAFLRMRASQPGTISEIITAMNRHLTQDVLETGRFMTLFYLTIDPENKRLDWVRAGHDPALVYDPVRDDFEELKGSGLALGVNEGFDYEENHRNGLTNGQIIAVGTDGIWEAVNRDGEMFGKERLRNVIRQNAEAEAGDILSAVYDELNQFTLGQKTEDDITLVIIKVDGLLT
ncbi:Serine phosphatase RsbU, regulator of sigma subunit [Olavius sp. associated proteobacterium Delta 1]|nr:Serine phosphatase RsbU, regulator of sigma subunit [Olavius sp. associated proteobacterium Delta 1]